MNNSEWKVLKNKAPVIKKEIQQLFQRPWHIQYGSLNRISSSNHSKCHFDSFKRIFLKNFDTKTQLEHVRHILNIKKRSAYVRVQPSFWNTYWYFCRKSWHGKKKMPIYDRKMGSDADYRCCYKLFEHVIIKVNW